MDEIRLNFYEGRKLGETELLADQDWYLDLLQDDIELYIIAAVFRFDLYLNTFCTSIVFKSSAQISLRFAEPSQKVALKRQIVMPVYPYSLFRAFSLSDISFFGGNFIFGSAPCPHPPNPSAAAIPAKPEPGPMSSLPAGCFLPTPGRSLDHYDTRSQ
jgi:hypothetical protein